MDYKTDFIKYHLRNAFAPGNLNPDSEHFDLNKTFNSLFYTDRPNHVVICDVGKTRVVESHMLKSRGARVVNYDDLFPDLDLDANRRANNVCYFLGSTDEPYVPYILVTATINEVAYSYFRKFNMTIFKLTKRDVPYFDYNIEWEHLLEIATRPINVYPPSYSLECDFLVSPEHSEVSRMMNELKLDLENHVKDRVDLFIYKPAYERVNSLTLRPDLLEFGMISDLTNKDYFHLNEGEVRHLISDHQKHVISSKRKFLVAGSGSGKTVFLRSHPDVFVEADKMFSWPKRDRWWEDLELAKVTNDNNRDILKKWLNAEADGKIVVYADTLGLTPDVFVSIPFEFHAKNLDQGKRVGQPSVKDLEIIEAGSKAEIARNPNVPVYQSISQALSYLKADGRFRIPRRHRDSNLFVFMVKKTKLDWAIQTYHSSQTWMVKSITYALSKFLGLGDHDMERPRSMAMLANNIRTLPNKKVGGIAKLANGKILPLTISGHMVNYTILTRFIPIDLSRLMDHVSWNFDLFLTNRKLNAREADYHRKEMFAEFNSGRAVYGLWHNPLEWWLGIVAGTIWLKYLNLGNVTKNDLVMIEFFKHAGKTRKLMSECIVVKEAKREGFTIFDYVDSDAISRFKVLADW